MRTTPFSPAVAVALALVLFPAQAEERTLDYEFFKARVEPIFLTKRPDHVRCYVCHSESTNAFKLEKLPEGKTFWSEEQSRRQFEALSRLVVPGEPEKSLLLIRPLAPEAGGHAYHSGGRQFKSRDDAEWKTIAAWINGQKLKGN
jgi:hypothetical protein